MNAGKQAPAPSRILVVTLRRLGDVLLTTPLIRTLRRAYPDAALDVLVFRGTERILEGNPDIAGVRTIAERPTLAETWRTIAGLCRRYDLVVSTQAGDRPTFFSWVAGARRIGLVPDRGGGVWWKRRVFHRSVQPGRREHRVETLLRLSDALGLRRDAVLVPPQRQPAGFAGPSRPFAVLHAHPMYRYKRWTEEGWRELARALVDRGLAVIATGGPDAAERAYLDAVWGAGSPAIERLDGRLDWPELAALLAAAAVYVGPDTSVTHLAAAAGCPTVALFGPTDPRLWAPWPSGGPDPDWEAAAGIQRRGNVWVVQNGLPCTPCQEEGCERRLDSFSACLDRMAVDQVLVAVGQALDAGRTRGVAGQLPLLNTP